MTDTHEPTVDPAEDGNDLGPENEPAEDPKLRSRRDFLVGLGKWSRVVITGAVLGSGMLLVDKPAQAGWLNRRGCCRGGSWINRRRGGSWINRRGGVRGGSWINRR